MSKGTHVYKLLKNVLWVPSYYEVTTYMLKLIIINIHVLCIALPDRPKHPGTMATIADRDVDGRHNRTKGPKCGQCEQTGAHVVSISLITLCIYTIE